MQTLRMLTPAVALLCAHAAHAGAALAASHEPNVDAPSAQSALQFARAGVFSDSGSDLTFNPERGSGHFTGVDDNRAATSSQADRRGLEPRPAAAMPVDAMEPCREIGGEGFTGFTAAPQHLTDAGATSSSGGAGQIPEPQTWLLLGFGLVMMAVRLRWLCNFLLQQSTVPIRPHRERSAAVDQQLSRSQSGYRVTHGRSAARAKLIRDSYDDVSVPVPNQLLRISSVCSPRSGGAPISERVTDISQGGPTRRMGPELVCSTSRTNPRWATCGSASACR